jgi:hypothetical protein
MNKKTKLTGAVLLSLSALMSANTAFAAGAVAFQDPSTAAWGGWSIGDAETSHGYWDVIADDAGGTAFDIDSSPDNGDFNNSYTELVANNPGAFVTGGGLGGNVYSFSDTPDWTLDIGTDYTFADAGTVTVALQMKVLGTLLDFSTVNLGGLGYDSAEVTYSGVAGGPFGGAEEEYLFVWEDVVASTAYSLNFAALGSSMSLDELQFDIGGYMADIVDPVDPIDPIDPPSAVPVPAAVFMFAPALLGFMGLRRKVKNSVA